MGVMLVAAARATPSAAQVYKWVDEKGTVHFTNDPPPKAGVEVLPDDAHRPLVRNGPPTPGTEEAESLPDDTSTARRPEAAEHEIESGEVIVDESETIIVDDGSPDLVTRRRANSPRNRPGQPIQQPRRAPRRAR